MWPICLAVVLVLAGVPGVMGRALAHGSPEKVIDERFVVTVALAPDGDFTRLRFFFRDFRTGRGLTEPMLFEFASQRTRPSPRFTKAART